MNDRLKIHILDSPHRDHLSANPASTVQPILPQVIESEEAVVELDGIKVIEPIYVQPELQTS